MENGYQLLDFGDGRKLEKFGPVVLDRVSPAADGVGRTHSNWQKVELCTPSNYLRLNEHGEIVEGNLALSHWLAELSDLRFRLKITPFGHVGLFPEQAENWQWLRQLLIAQSYAPQALNLFAYTGGSTLALAQAGFQVVHVDASAPAVRWARENAMLNQLEQKPIRWIVEDARKFTSRELKRGRSYDAIVLDPPSFGHGPTGDRWEIAVDLFPLLENCLQLLIPGGSLLFSAHATSPNLDEIMNWFHQQLDGRFRVHSQRIKLRDLNQRELDCGYCIRVHGAGVQASAAPSAGVQALAAPSAGVQASAAPSAGVQASAAPSAGVQASAAQSAGVQASAAPSAGVQALAAPSATHHPQAIDAPEDRL